MSIKKYHTVALTFALSTLTTVQVHAADSGLTSILRSKAFSGSMEVVSKFNWLGWLMNFIISAFCILGLFMIFYQRIITLLYLSARTLFDNVNDVKNSSKGSFFGLPTLAQKTFQSEYGTGLDAFVGFLYGLLPDVKKYSDYNPEKRKYNLNDEDSASSYMLKVGPTTIALVFFFSIGFSGTLTKGYATVVDAMAVVADTAVDVNLDKYVEQLLHAGNNYKFGLSADGSQKGKVQEAVAKSIYNKIIGKAEILDTATRLQVGKKVEQYVAQNYSTANMSNFTDADSFSEKDWGKINFEVIDNTNDSNEVGDRIEFTQLLPDNYTSTGTPLYIHVYFTEKDVDTTKWFETSK